MNPEEEQKRQQQSGINWMWWLRVVLIIILVVLLVLLAKNFLMPKQEVSIDASSPSPTLQLTEVTAFKR